MPQDDFQILNSQYFYYGTTPKQAVAEQNQTYFAYFDGVGGTGPEVIDQTAYFIKYLIDINGNVVNPEPDVVPSRPQAIALYNLVDNFEVNKKAVVKLIENNPTYDITPNSKILTGIHPITYVGRIVPILVSETGQNIQDYTTTMSFGPQSTPSPPNLSLIPSVSAQFQASFGTLIPPNPIFQTTYTDLPYDTTLTQYTNESIWTNNSPEFTLNSSSAQTSTRIKIQAKIYVYGPEPPIDSEGNPTGAVSTNILWLRILQNNTQIAELDYVVDSNFHNSDAPIGGGGYIDLATTYIDYEADDVFKVQYKVDNEDYPLTFAGTAYQKWESRIRIAQEYPAGISGSSNTNVDLIDGINAVYSPYFFAAVNEPYSNNLSQNGYALNGGTSFLVTTENLYNIYSSNLIQTLDSASAAMNFSPITIPFQDVKPGDFIRFEYNKNQVYTIAAVFENTVTPGLVLQVTPAITNLAGINTQTIDINHFVIYRVINDGTYVVLDVKKDVPGGAYSGILQPEYISQELVNKTDQIITDLTTREIIN